MATEYVFYGEADVPSSELQSFVAGAVNGSVTEGTIIREGMNVMAYRVGPDEETSVKQAFGFEHRITVTFRFTNLSSAETRGHNIAVMVGAVLGILDGYPGRGVLLFNGEEVTLQRLANGVVFNEDWEDWEDYDEVSPLITERTVGPVAQPLL
jgi:hypothetical protein